MDRAILALMALMLNALLAGPREWYAALGLTRLSRRPVVLLRDLERRLNREHRRLEVREMRGTVLVIAVMAASIILGGIGEWLFRHRLGFMSLLIVTAALPVRPTWDIVSQLRRALYAGDVHAAKETLEGTPWRHHALLDEYGVARAGIELLAVQFSEKIVAPVFWYLILGLPGLLVSRSVYLLQETLSPPGADGGFGRTAQAVHYVLHYVPARLAALLWLAAAVFLPSVKWRDVARRISGGMTGGSPQALALLAAASVLNVTLGGPSSPYVQRWIGTGTARPGVYDLKRALFVFALLHPLLFVVLGFFL
ncbi:MAG: cobalamin biosynthesis protein [Pseudomonadota bacterium]|nr:cobalamin biosynthesis protein [Pseudomonadota bacterium]